MTDEQLVKAIRDLLDEDAVPYMIHRSSLPSEAVKLLHAAELRIEQLNWEIMRLQVRDGYSAGYEHGVASGYKTGYLDAQHGRDPRYDLG
jgi:hypothetical protein